jgi:nitroreductase
MDFLDAVKSRRSIRAFMDTPVEKDKIRKVLEAANSAPSAHNSQEYEIFLMEDRRKIEELKSAVRQEFILKAPAVLVFCAHLGQEKDSKRPLSEMFPVQDATIAASYAQLAAAALGLGSVWVGSFDPDKLREVLGAPKEFVPVVLMPIGYPAEHPEAKPRRSLDDIVHRM